MRSGMAFSEWQVLAPEDAADEVLRRLRGLGAGATAAVASLPPREELVRRFSAAPRGTGLAGVPYFAKDLFDVAGEPTRAGSVIYAHVRPAPLRDGAMVRAFREAGAVLAGKAHLHEFAYGLTGENPHYGDCDNPRFPGHTTGGSSSGSAALVAAGVVPLATGTDTGGSIRVPAAHCGIFGFRMTPGHAWIADAFPLAPSFDTAGWFTAEPGDMAVALEALGLESPGAASPRGCFLEMPGVEAEVSDAVGAYALDLAAPADAAQVDTLARAFAGAAESYAVLQSREAFAVHRDSLDRYREGYSPAVWARIDRGRRWSPGQIDRAERHQDLLGRTWAEFFREWDFLVLAAAPFAAPAHGRHGPEHRDRQLALTAPASIAGLPVLTVPFPLPNGGSGGLQIIAKTVDSPVFRWVLRFEANRTKRAAKRR